MMEDLNYLNYLIILDNAKSDHITTLAKARGLPPMLVV